eukprot:3676344-Rhodomonas_salina.1
MFGTETGYGAVRSWSPKRFCAACPRSQTQKQLSPVQFVPRCWLILIDFAPLSVRACACRR